MIVKFNSLILLRCKQIMCQIDLFSVDIMTMIVNKYHYSQLWLMINYIFEHYIPMMMMMMMMMVMMMMMMMMMMMVMNVNMSI